MPWYLVNVALSAAFNSLDLSLSRTLMASDVRYMSLRVLPAASAGMFLIEP